MKKKKMMMVIIFIIVCLIIGFLVGNYFYNLALDKDSDKSIVFEAPHNSIDSELEVSEPMMSLPQYQEVHIKSRDGLRLQGYEYKQEENRQMYAIVAHGYSMHALSMEKTATEFYQRGYNVLMPDARGHGKSEGHYIGMGWHERLDMLKWIDYIIKKNEDVQIVLYGVSMGGATVMMTSGEQLPKQVKAIIEDCGYSSIKKEFTYQLKELFGLPSFPILNFASAVTKIRAGYFLKDGDALVQVKKAKVPILFIHGTADTFVPFFMLDEVYNAKSGDKEKYIVEGAGHGMASTVAGSEYWKKVESFLDKHMFKLNIS